MITYFGWGIIITLIVIALTFGVICMVKKERCESVAKVSLFLQVVVLIAAMFGTKDMVQFGLGQIIAYVILVVVVWAWTGITETVSKIKLEIK